MNILQVVPSLRPETGGPAFSVPSIARGLAAEGHHVTMLTADWPSDGERGGKYPPEVEGVTVRAFPSEAFWPAPYLPHSPGLRLHLRETARHFDVVLVHSLWNPVATFAMRDLRKRAIPYIAMLHGMMDPLVFECGPWRKRAWAFLWEKQNIERAELVVSTTPVAEQKALAAGWKLKKTLVLPHPIPIEQWEDLPPPALFDSQFPSVRGRRVILYVGRLDWVKNLDKLLRALPLVRTEFPSAMLVLAGPDSGGHRGEIERLAREMALEDHVLFTGMMEGEDLKAAYARANTLALVSRKENFGLAAAQALAAGLPIVLSTGVDLGHHWPGGGPVVRVSPEPADIAGGLIRMLERNTTAGLPDPQARALARAEFGAFRIPDLVRELALIVARRSPASKKSDADFRGSQRVSAG